MSCVGGAAPGDCDDGDAARNPADADGDGVSTCAPTVDCDDGDSGAAPGLPEGCNGRDDDCDGLTPPWDIDGDGDGQSLCAGDCDDGDAGRSAIDGDGDGQSPCSNPADCDDADPAVVASDADADGFSDCGNDCDDSSAAANPGRIEVCDLLDNDCDGAQASDEVDEDGDLAAACLDCDDLDADLRPGDLDGDGFDGCGGDCDDGDAATFPFAPDAPGDGLDLDCDGVDGTDADGDGAVLGLDCDDGDPSLNQDDVDGDLATTCGGDCDDGDPALSAADDDADGFSTCEGDCRDSAWSVHPGTPEVCDLIDNDCDGQQPPGEVDADGDGDAACLDCEDTDPTVTTADADGDGLSSCVGDCDDDAAWIRPGLPDTFGDLIDADCDGTDGLDADGDGSPQGLDCDDGDATLDRNDGDGDGFTPCSGDCDDGDADTGPEDGDGDGFSACDGDCDDGAWAAHPGAAETCDVLDNDCDGVQAATEIDLDGDGDAACLDCDDDDASLHTLDIDGDGSDSCGGDCDDTDGARRPGAPDPYGDSTDGDCDGIDGTDGDGDGAPQGLDCDDSDATANLQDGDSDLWSSCAGDCDDADPALSPADADWDGWTLCEGDCDDATWPVHPLTAEVCNLVDDDCDGDQPVDEVDADADGDPACADCDDADPALLSGDGDGDGSSTCDGDCDDADAATRPDAFDAWGDGRDLDCDGIDGIDGDGDGDAQGPDCNDANPLLNRADADGDGWDTCAGDCEDGDPSLVPTDADHDGFTVCGGDCDDGAFAVHPLATESCNLWDDDCDGVQGPDEVDGDGDGDAACADCDDGDATVDALDRDADGASLCDGDCDDLDLSFRPAASDLFGDGWDTNCDGADGTDGDGDGYASLVSLGTDCDDGDAAIHPGAVEVGFDAVDQDCDGLDGADADSDGHVAMSSAGDDCDDNDASVHPGATDTWGDGIDQNCDLGDGADADGDGWGDTASLGPDCDDQDAAVHPGTWEPTDGVDSNCDGRDGLNWSSVPHNLESTQYSVGMTGRCDWNGDGVSDLAFTDRITPSGSESWLRIHDGPHFGPPGTEDWDAAVFGASSPSVTLNVGGAICAGDEDGDGIDDLLVAGSYAHPWPINTSGLRWFLFHGPLDGYLSAVAADSWLSWTDLGTILPLPDTNGDGLDDVLICSGPWGNYTCRLHLGPWAGVSGPTGGAATLSLQNPWAPEVGDWDGDGDLDLVVVDVQDDTVATDTAAVLVWTGPLVGTRPAPDGRVLFPAPDYNPPHATNVRLADGSDVLVIAEGSSDYTNAQSATIRRLSGPLPGNRLFSTLPEVTTTPHVLGGLSACDIDGDGGQDLVWSSWYYDSALTTHTAMGWSAIGTTWDAPWTSATFLDVLSAGSGYSGLSCGGDFDLDGAEDLLLPGLEPRMAWNPIGLFCSTTDQDGDGASPCDGDCADADPTRGPDSIEIVADGLDSDCDGWDGHDDDGDLVAAIASGGLDCDDDDPLRQPGAEDTPGDGIDQDCDGQDDLDIDADGDVALESGGSDCDDADATVHSGSEDPCGDGIDQDCLAGDEPCYSVPVGRDLTTGSWAITGLSASNLNSFVQVAHGGDFNGDGFDDLVLAYSQWAGPLGSGSGGVFIHNGPIATSRAYNAGNATRYGTRASASAGSSVAVIPDRNGDGRDELAIGSTYGGPSSTNAPGTVSLFFGPITGSASVATAAVQRTGEAHGDGAGAVADAGDLDGDGARDLVIGAGGYGDNGAAYVLYGPLSGVQTLPAGGARVTGELPGDFFGLSVAAAGDTDGDGLGEILVYANDAAIGGPSGQAVYLIEAPPIGNSSAAQRMAAVFGSVDAIVPGPPWDWDGDGLSDILVGGRVFFGPLSGLIPLSTSEVQVRGMWDSASAMGDYDGDGREDLLAERVGYGNRTAIVLGGSASSDAAYLAGPQWPLTFSSSVPSYMLWGAGDLDADGQPDIVLGNSTLYVIPGSAF